MSRISMLVPAQILAEIDAAAKSREKTRTAFILGAVSAAIEAGRERSSIEELSRRVAAIEAGELPRERFFDK